MANLLPTADRQALRTERWWRLASVGCVMVAGVFVGGLLLLVPSLFAVRASRGAVADRLAATEELIDLQQAADVDAALTSLNEKIQTVETLVAAGHPYELIEDIIENIPSGVHVTMLSWRAEGPTAVVDVSGLADTRAALISLGDALRASGLFSDVVIPVEALAPQVDLDFRLSIELATPQ